MGFNEFLSKMFGNKSQRDLREILPIVEKVKSAYEVISKLTNDEVRARTQSIREEIRLSVKEENDKIAELKATIESAPLEQRNKLYDEIDKLEKTILEKLKEELDLVLPEVFAIMKDTARRFKDHDFIEVTANEMDRLLATKFDFVRIEGDKAIYSNSWMAGGNLVKWDMVHFDVQLVGGVALHKGKIAEMATGEGKTLVATLPVFLNALTGRGVHLVTVNDYLARRDSEWMGPLYMYQGLTVDCIDKHDPNSEGRKIAYQADITFGTNNEFGFDYLRDNMANSPLDVVQREHYYAIIDEVDSVLIDDARTPLIISGPVPKGDDQLFEELLPKVERLYEAQRALVSKLLADSRNLLKSANSDQRKEGALLLFRAHKGLPKNKPLIKFLSEQGIKAEMQKAEAYYMQDNNREMHIVTDPLYFVIDERNNSVELTDKGIDLITGHSDDPYFFVLPNIGEKMSELDRMHLNPEEKQLKKDEIIADYSVKQERVHTIHQLLKAYTLFERDDDYVVLNGQVKIVDEQTGRVMEGRRYSDGLHQALEAKERVKIEAATQTFATITLQNYFRMYHKLAGMTGTAETEAGELWDIYKLDVMVIPTNRPLIRIDHNDRVYKTKREKYAAVIDEITNLIEAGRPVLVGTTSVEISELLSRMLTARKIQHNVLNAKQNQREAEIVAQAGQKSVVTVATNMAGRGTDIKLSQEVREAGGLAIVGTERHESRRVDRQLRGRAGRQGDPGSSVFYVSLEDDLMRLFGSERITSIMDRLGFKEGEMIEHPMISRSIQRAQMKVEENNFGIRKRLLEYDDVMNAQRTVIYQRRNHALSGERIETDIFTIISEAVYSIVDQTHSMLDYEGLQEEAMTIFGMDLPFNEDEFRSMRHKEVVDVLFQQAVSTFKRKMDKLASIAYPVIKQVYETPNQTYQNILIPLSDGQRLYNIPVNLEAAYNSEGKEVIKAFEKAIILMIIDDEWKDHLREMDDLRDSVQNASYEQKDPLLIYKLESFSVFKDMIDRINRRTTAILMRGQIPLREPEQVQQAAQEHRSDFSRYKTHKGGVDGDDPTKKDTREVEKQQPVHVEKKIGRNDPCPCGSGKKYKNCHGKGL
ncbi:MAG: preprotein translocase subunit SecA [Microbacter sp.]